MTGNQAGWAHGVEVRGARQNNLKDVDLDVPRDAIVVFTGVSGSGKSSLAFGTLYAESQRRYLESVAPYARRLIDQAGVPDVDSVEGMPPAVALQQQRGGGNARSTVASVTTLSNLVRMLYSRAGWYPPGQPMLYAEDFSSNTPQGACPTCDGMGRVYEVTAAQMVPDPDLTIRERAIASWPPAWQGQNLRDILVSMGFDVDIPWRRLASEGPRMDPLHRRAPDRAGVCRTDPGADPARHAGTLGAELPGNLHRRAPLHLGHVRVDQERHRQATRIAVRHQRGLSNLPRKATQGRVAVGHLRGP